MTNDIYMTILEVIINNNKNKYRSTIIKTIMVSNALGKIK